MPLTTAFISADEALDKYFEEHMDEWKANGFGQPIEPDEPGQAPS